MNASLGLLGRFRRFAWDALGICFVAFSLMSLIHLFLPELADGVVLVFLTGLLRQWLGWGVLLAIIAAAFIGLLMLRIQPERMQLDPTSGKLAQLPWGRLLALELAGFAILALLSAANGYDLERAETGLDGGQIGWGLAELARLVFERFSLNWTGWGILIYGLVAFVCLFYATGLAQLTFKAIARWVETEGSKTTFGGTPAISVSPVTAEGASQGTAVTGKPRRSPLPMEFRKQLRVAPKEEKPAAVQPRDERLPPLDLLVYEQAARPDERNINQTAGMIEKTLAEFGIPAKVIGFRVGPTVTQFAVEPGFIEKPGSEEEANGNKQKVRVSQISSLQRDLALVLAAERLRIEAPVPGRPYIGIEVPNVRTTVVRLRPILESEVFYRVNSPLAIALGRDVSGHPVVADLSKMPHLLIAGTTGSGKSVCIAALTACLVMNNTPQDLRLVMVDPKMVELVRFNGLPHLYGKVETDLQRILGVLRWVVVEMDRRYKLLEELHARHIDSYNRKIQRKKGFQPLPRIVVLIDELADLMMAMPDQTEHMLTRLAQMARATGIHLVVATQRPSTDVITGLIKANFPARISFAVASSVDSRVILDLTGAETLLGHGDMLFLSPDASAPIRCQGVMISDSEIEKAITFWQQSHPPDATEQPPWEVMLSEEQYLAERDNLVEKAIEVVRQTQHASASLLQRRLRIGYPRAARLMDELEHLGIVGPSPGGGREREVLIEPGDSHEYKEEE